MKWVRGCVLLLSVTGCAENSTIYHSRSIDTVRPHAVTVDSYQRSTYFSQPTGEDLRVCAEAAPDTFSALSASIAAEGDVKTQQARLAGAISQSGATIERTQTINLLRESLYRTCERYLSGAINKATLVVQAARDQRTMVTVLAIEQLTRTIRPPSTVISGAPTKATLPDKAAVGVIVAARKEVDAAQASVEAAKEAFDAADKVGKCSTILVAPVDGAGVPDVNWTACDAARIKLTLAEGEAEKADGRLGQALGLAGPPAGEGALASGTGAGPQDAGGGGQPSSASVAAVADAIVAIVNAPAIDEAMMFCVGYLGKKPKPDDQLDPGIKGTCLSLLDARGKSEQALVDMMIANGTPHNVFAPDAGGDTAGPIINAYIASARRGSERKRRIALATQASAAVGGSSDPVEVIADLTQGDAVRHQALLNVLAALETDAVGRALLTPR